MSSASAYLVASMAPSSNPIFTTELTVPTIWSSLAPLKVIVLQEASTGPYSYQI